MPADVDARSGLALGKRRQRRLEPALADVAPRAHDVRYDVDRSTSARASRSPCSLAVMRAGSCRRRIAPRVDKDRAAIGAKSPLDPIRRIHATMPAQRWDIFCNVVDNFGDAGVSLAARAAARARARHRGHAVDRRCSRASRASRPGSTPRRDDQAVADVRVRALAEPLARRSRCPTSSIEAFGCGLPDALRRSDGATRRGRRSGSSSNTCPPSRGSKARTGCRRRIRACRSRATSGFPDSRRRPAACCARRACSRRATRRAVDPAARATHVARARASTHRRRTRCASRCSAIRTPRCRRCSTRGPKATSRSRASCPKASPRRRSTRGPAARRAACRRSR